jgi:hypothetical protein
MRPSTCLLLAAMITVACARPEPLTKEKAEQIIKARAFKSEPVYAEVPQRVWWSPTAPKDDFDDKSLRTFEHLRRAGLITVTEQQRGVVHERVAKVTEKGFRILGTAPSLRGPVYRGNIAEKVYDGIQNFQRHPTEPTVGSAQLIWHYTNPTFLYPMFETKINKPLDKPFASVVSFYFKDHQWRLSVIVRKTEAEPGAESPAGR